MPTFEVSGGAHIVAGHARRLAARGHQVYIVVPCPQRPSIKQRLKAFIFNSQGPLSPSRAPVALAGVPLIIPQRPGPIQEHDVPDADVIVGTWFETIEWIWPMSPAKGSKVHFIQGYDAPPQDVGQRVEQVWQLPTGKIAIAQWLLDVGKERFDIANIALAPNSVDHRLFDLPRRNRGQPPIVGFLFHNAAFKDLASTVATIKQLQQVRPDVRFISFGSSMPKEGELPRGVEFHHLPTQEKIAEIYQRCNAWLSTSRTEGFNLPPLEAMASGCPAVCSKTGRPLEIIEDGVNGYLVDAGDVAGFMSALAKILSLNDEDWQRMSVAARDAVAHPTWDESSAMFERALLSYAKMESVD